MPRAWTLAHAGEARRARAVSQLAIEKTFRSTARLDAALRQLLSKLIEFVILCLQKLYLCFQLRVLISQQRDLPKQQRGA